MATISYGDLQSAEIDGVTTVTSVIAAPGEGSRVLIVGLALTLDAAGEVTLQSATTDLVSAMELLDSTSLVLPVTELGWFLCGDNEAFRLTSTTAANGTVRYRIV